MAVTASAMSGGDEGLECGLRWTGVTFAVEVHSTESSFGIVTGRRMAAFGAGHEVKQDEGGTRDPEPEIGGWPGAGPEALRVDLRKVHPPHPHEVTDPGVVRLEFLQGVRISEEVHSCPGPGPAHELLEYGDGPRGAVEAGQRGA